MNRKKAIDFAVPRRPRERVLYDFSSPKSRSDSSKDQNSRDRGDGGREKIPFWSRDEKNLGSEPNFNTFQMFDKRRETVPGDDRDLSRDDDRDLRRDDVLKSLQKEISRAVLSQDAKDDSSLFARGNEDSYSRGGIRGPIIDEFSEDAYNFQSGSYSKRTDFRDSKEQQRRKTDERSSRKRSYSPIDEKSSSYRKSRGDTPTNRSQSSNSNSGRRNDDDDLRNVLKQFQKSKWDDDGASTPDKKRYDSKDYDGKRDRNRNRDTLEVSPSNDMFSLSSPGTLGPLPLEPLSDSRDYFGPGSSGDYREEDRHKGYKGLYSDSIKDRDSGDSRDQSRTRYRPSKQDRRGGSLDDGQRGRDRDVDDRDSRYSRDKRDSLNDADVGLLFDRYGESSDLGGSTLISDTLRDLPLTELAEQSSQKFKTGFELGRPFFGFSSSNKKKEGDSFVDYVSILNQYCQKNRINTPKYDEFPGVQGSFGVQVYVSGQKFTSMNYCSNKKEARHDAARSALLALDIPGGLQDPVFRGESTPSSKPVQRDVQDNSYYKDSKNNNSRQQRGSLKTVSKSSTTAPSLPRSDKSKSSTFTTQKLGPKPLFPSGFLPRQLQKPVGKNVQKAGVDKSMEPPLLPKKGGYFPKTMEVSRSRSKSSERGGDDKKDAGISNSSSKREVKPPSKGKFTTQNWSDLQSKDNREESKENNSFSTTKPQGSGQGRGIVNANNRGRGGAFNPRGRGRGFRGRGVGSGPRGRGVVTLRGRGFGFRGRGRGRGISQPPVGATVRNIFRRSRSPSPLDSKYRRSSRSPGSPRRDSRSRSERKKDRRSRSRSRSSSFCSTCSSHSCSTCRSWRSVSLDSLSGKGDGGRKRHHKTKTSSKEEKEKDSAKAVDKLKSDIKNMEKQLEQKSAKGVDEKKRDASKVNREPKPAATVSKTVVKDKTKDIPSNTKDKPSSSKDALVVKDDKGKNSREVKKEVKKKTDAVREVILKSDKRKESPQVTKKEKNSPVREVKIVNEKKIKGVKGDEKSGSKMKIDTLKITIDQPEKMPDPKKDTKKEKKKDKMEEEPQDSVKRSSKSPPGKQKKKEKVKSKKAKKKAKKRKNDRDNEDSGDESIYSSISGQDDFSGNDEKSGLLQASRDERIVEISSESLGPSKYYAHFTKRGTEGEVSTTHPSRKNLISIPLLKEITESNILPHPRRPRPKQQQADHPVSKGEQDENSGDAQYTDVSLSNESDFGGNVDWETAKFAGEYETESAATEQDYSTSYQDNENINQEWPSEQGEVGDPDNYYYEEGTEDGGYEQEYYPQYQEGDWQTGDQEEYLEWFEGEYPQEGAEGVESEAGAVYEGEYYLAEDGLYYPVEGEAYQEYQDYQGEYTEGGTEGEALSAGQDAAYTEGDYQYQYSEEGGEWQQYDEAAAYQAEEVWNQGEAEGQWQEEYHEGYHAAESDWSTEYIQGNEFESGAQGYAEEGTEMPQEGFNADEGYDQQLPQEEYYTQSVAPQEQSHHVEHGFHPLHQEETVEHNYTEEPLASKNESKDMPVTYTVSNVDESKPLKSILKKSRPVEENGKGTKLVSERLAQMRKQSTSKADIPLHSSTSTPSVESVKKEDQNPDKKPGQEEAERVQSESDRYREMEEAILSSQPKDAVGTEYVVRVHGSGTAQFYCKLCQCHFNTLTAKNLHIKGMKHIELYIRMKSSLLQSVIRDTKVENAAKRPAEDAPQAAQKVPRRF